MMGYIDIYCERLAPGLWAEPLNLITNAAFFIAAFFAWRLGRDDAAVRILAGLMVFIGIGSSLFHSFATSWSQIMDVIPILLFQTVFLWVYARRVMKVCASKTVGALVIFVMSGLQADNVPSDILNGSVGYAPALIFITVMGIWHFNYIPRERFVLLLAAAVFAVSLTLRSVDMLVCSALETGTHFLWHCLNGLVLYLCVRGYAQSNSRVAC